MVLNALKAHAGDEEDIDDIDDLDKKQLVDKLECAPSRPRPLFFLLHLWGHALALFLGRRSAVPLCALCARRSKFIYKNEFYFGFEREKAKPDGSPGKITGILVDKKNVFV